jgi:membrane-associated phospholipid phosphatase
LVAVAVFFGLWLFGNWLSPLVAQPRPSPALIHVFGHPPGFAFPSIFGLLYAATFGYIALLALAQLRATLAVAIAVVSLLILLIGACARIVLGAHWPSDLWVAFLIGLFWIELLLPARGGET